LLTEKVFRNIILFTITYNIKKAGNANTQQFDYSNLYVTFQELIFFFSGFFSINRARKFWASCFLPPTLTIAIDFLVFFPSLFSLNSPSTKLKPRRLSSCLSSVENIAQTNWTMSQDPSKRNRKELYAHPDRRRFKPSCVLNDMILPSLNLYLENTVTVLPSWGFLKSCLQKNTCLGVVVVEKAVDIFLFLRVVLPQVATWNKALTTILDLDPNYTFPNYLLLCKLSCFWYLFMLVTFLI